MKSLLVLLLSLSGWASSTSWAQGTVYFANRVVGVLDAPVTYMGWGIPLAKANGEFVAQLWAAPPGGTLSPVGDPIPFRDQPEVARGYWLGETRTIPGVPENGTAQVQVRAWWTALGSSLDEVMARGMGGWGLSEVLDSIQTGGGLNPPTPLVGLRSFEISIVPEPGGGALLVVGGLLVVPLRRRPSRIRG